MGKRVIISSSLRTQGSSLPFLCKILAAKAVHTYAWTTDRGIKNGQPELNKQDTQSESSETCEHPYPSCQLPSVSHTWWILWSVEPLLPQGDRQHPASTGTASASGRLHPWQQLLVDSHTHGAWAVRCMDTCVRLCLYIIKIQWHNYTSHSHSSGAAHLHQPIGLPWTTKARFQGPE